MSRHFVRHSIKVGEHSRFVMYQKTSDYIAYRIGWIAIYIVLILPIKTLFKIIYYISSAVLKVLLNGIFTLVYWIRGKKDSSTISDNEKKLRDIYFTVDNIAVIFGYICDAAVIAFLIYLFSLYMKQREQAKQVQYAIEQVQSSEDGVPKTEEVSENDSLDKPYHIWCEAFVDEEEAQKGVKKLSQKGIEANVDIIENPESEGGGLVYVLSVGEYSSKKKAKKMLKKVQKYYPDAIVANVEGKLF